MMRPPFEVFIETRRTLWQFWCLPLTWRLVWRVERHRDPFMTFALGPFQIRRYHAVLGRWSASLGDGWGA